jgi:chromosomal replication initiator protein
LLRAIGQHIQDGDGTRRVVYLTAERFVNELVSLLHQDRSASPFRHRYRQADVLLVDDIHYLAGKQHTQEEFFHTFNSLHEAGKQIVLSSDKSPQDITPLDRRLRSRFGAGLMADIQPPGLQTRLAILTRKAEERQVTLPQDAARLIASRIRSHVTALETALARVIAHASLHGQRVDAELTHRVLEQLAAERDRSISASRIQQTVAQHFDIEVGEMQSKGRQRAVTFPRQVAMFLCRELTDASLPEIGRDFGGKDHSTVLHSCTKIARLEETDEAIARLLWQLRRRLEETAN